MRTYLGSLFPLFHDLCSLPGASKSRPTSGHNLISSDLDFWLDSTPFSCKNHFCSLKTEGDIKYMTHFQMGRSLHHLYRPSHQILSLLAVLKISLWKPRLILIKYMCLCLSVYVPTTLGLHNHLKKGITCNSSTASYLHLSYYF